jgi:hypothetical protein
MLLVHEKMRCGRGVMGDGYKRSDEFYQSVCFTPAICIFVCLLHQQQLSCFRISSSPSANANFVFLTLKKLMMFLGKKLTLASPVDY